MENGNREDTNGREQSPALGTGAQRTRRRKGLAGARGGSRSWGAEPWQKRGRREVHRVLNTEEKGGTARKVPCDRRKLIRI